MKTEDRLGLKWRHRILNEVYVEVTRFVRGVEAPQISLFQWPLIPHAHEIRQPCEVPEIEGKERKQWEPEESRTCARSRRTMTGEEAVPWTWDRWRSTRETKALSGPPATRAWSSLASRWPQTVQAPKDDAFMVTSSKTFGWGVHWVRVLGVRRLKLNEYILRAM